MRLAVAERWMSAKPVVLRSSIPRRLFAASRPGEPGADTFNICRANSTSFLLPMYSGVR